MRSSHVFLDAFRDDLRSSNLDDDFPRQQLSKLLVIQNAEGFRISGLIENLRD